MVYEPLLSAVENGASLDEIRALLEERPEEESRDRALFEVIEKALLHKAGTDVLKLLIQQDPTCAQTTSDEGDSLLLHLACYRRAPYDIIKLLYQLNPYAIRVADDDGDLPLHCLCYDDTEAELSMDVLKLIVSKFPNAVQKTNREGEIPLHIACREEARADIVRFLVSCYPEGLCKPDSNNELPIHRACAREDASTNVVNVLINEYPEAASIKDEYGRLPLHIACENRNWEAAQVLLRVYPDGARTFDDGGVLPLHAACLEGAPLDLVRMLVEAYPESVRVSSHTSLDRLTLHRACTGHVPVDVLEFLLELHPDAVHVADGRGMLPLHCAFDHFTDSDHVRILVQADPLTLLRKTHEGKTALELAYASQRANGETNRFLLEKQREVVQAHQDAVEYVVGRCLDFVDNNNNFPELVGHRIWQFAQPDVWYPPENND